MTTSARLRLPYEDAAPVHEMATDCRQVESRLQLVRPRGGVHAAPVEHRPTDWSVAARATELANRLTLG